MSELNLNNYYNSELIFNYLQQNKNVLTAYLQDGTKLSGRLLGWDSDFLLVLYGKTLQVIPREKLLRLQAELDNTKEEIVEERTVISDLPKPKITPEPTEGSEIKDQLMADKAKNANKDTPPTQDRLENLVRNW